MHKRSIRFSILLVILTFFVGFGAAFVAPKPVKAATLEDFISQLTLGDFIRNLFEGLFGGNTRSGDPTYPTATPTTFPGASCSYSCGGCQVGFACSPLGCTSGQQKCNPTGPTPTPTIVCGPSGNRSGIMGFVDGLLGREPTGNNQCQLPTPTPAPCQEGTSKMACERDCPSGNCESCANDFLHWRCMPGPTVTPTSTPVPSNHCRTDCNECPEGQYCSGRDCLLAFLGYEKCIAGTPPANTPTPTTPSCPPCQRWESAGPAGAGCRPIANGTSCGGSNVCTAGNCGPYVNECTWSCEDSNCSANQACEYSDCPLGKKKCDFTPNCGSDPSICTSQLPRKVCAFEDGRYQCVAPSPTATPVPTNSCGICSELQGTKCVDSPSGTSCGGTNVCHNGSCVTPTPGPCLDICMRMSGYKCVPWPNGTSCGGTSLCVNGSCLAPTATPAPVFNCGTVNCEAPKVCSNPGPGIFQCVNPTATPTRVPPTPTTGPRTPTPTRVSPTPTPTNAPGCAPYCLTGVNCLGACVSDGCSGNYQRCVLYTPTPSPTTNPCPYSNIEICQDTCGVNNCTNSGCSANRFKCSGPTVTPTPRPNNCAQSCSNGVVSYCTACTNLNCTQWNTYNCPAGSCQNATQCSADPTATPRPTFTPVPLPPTSTPVPGGPTSTPAPTYTPVPLPPPPTEPPSPLDPTATPPGPTRPGATITPTTPVGAPCYYNVKLINLQTGVALDSALQTGTTEVGGCRTEGARELVPSFYTSPSQFTNLSIWPCTDATYVGDTCTQGIVTGQFVCMGGPLHEIKGCFNRSNGAYQRVSIVNIVPTAPPDATVTPTSPAGSTATPAPPTHTPTPLHNSFQDWFSEFFTYLSTPNTLSSLSLTVLEDWRDNTPVGTPTPPAP